MRGLSLLEILIGITVAAVAGLLLINLMVSSNNVVFNQSVQVTQGLSLNQTASEITEAIKSSAGVAFQYPVSGSPQYVSDATTLVLKIPAVTASGGIIDSVFDYQVITRDGGNSKILRSLIFPDAASSRNQQNKVLSTDLASINFHYYDLSNGTVTPAQGVRIGFVINLTGQLDYNEGSASGIVNIKNI